MCTSVGTTVLSTTLCGVGGQGGAGCLEPWWHVTSCGADWVTSLDTSADGPLGILHCSLLMPAAVLDSEIWAVTRAYGPLVEALHPGHSIKCLKKSDTNGPVKNLLCESAVASLSPVVTTWRSRELVAC